MAALTQQELGDKLLAACDALYSPASSQQVRNGANDWLTSFRFTEEAWMIAHTLLARGPQQVRPEVLFFAAQTLHEKLRHDFDQLPPQSLPQLCQSIIAHVYRFSAGPKNVLTKLCLALSALAVHTHAADMWGPQRDVVGTLIGTFTKGGDARHVVCLLELLHVLLAEADDERLHVDAETRGSFQHTVAASCKPVLAFLQSALQQSGSNPKVHEGIFRCFASWVYWGNIPAGQLMQTSAGLVNAVFGALATDHLFDVAVDAALELIRVYYDHRVHGPVAQVLVPGVMSQAKRLADAVAAGDEDTAVGLTRLLVELGESYMDLIVGPHEMNQQQVVATVLSSALHEAPGVARLTLRFWRLLAVRLSETAPGGGGPGADVLARRRAQFAPMVQQLATSCVRRCVLPASRWNEAIGAVSEIEAATRGPAGAGAATQAVANSVRSSARAAADGKTARMDFRAEFAYTLKEDCVDILGFPACLNMVLQAVQAAVQGVMALGAAGGEAAAQAAWRTLEGAVFAASAVVGAPGIRITDFAEAPAMRELMSMMPKIATGMGAYAAGAGVRYCGAVQLMVRRAIVGMVHDETNPRRPLAACRWYGHPRNRDFVVPMMQVVLGMLVPTVLPAAMSVAAADVAAPGLRNMCDACGQHVPLAALQQFYTNLLGAPGGALLSKYHHRDIVEAVAKVINAQQSVEARGAGFSCLLTPLATQLHALLQQPRLDVGSAASLLDRIQAVVRRVNMGPKESFPAGGPEHPTVSAARQMWAMFDQVVARAGHDPNTVEKLFSIYKHIIRKDGTQASCGVLLAPILAQVEAVYSRHPLSPALYMLRVCISDLAGASPQLAARLATSFAQCVEHTSGRYLPSAKEMRNMPDVVDDFFLLVCRVVGSRVEGITSALDNVDIVSRCVSFLCLRVMVIILLFARLFGMYGVLTVSTTNSIRPQLFRCECARPRRCVHLGTMGLLQDHPDALMSVFSFFERLFTSAATGKRPARRQALMTCLGTRGGAFMVNVVMGICGEIPMRHICHGEYTLARVVAEIGIFDLTVLNQLLVHALAQLSASYASDAEKREFGTSLVNSFKVVSGSTKEISRQVHVVVGDFAHLSRQNRARWRRKQLAAKQAAGAKKR